MLHHPGWILVILGGAILVAGLVWIFAPGLPLGRLPGDVRIETEHTRIYFPIVTCIILSIVLSAALWIVQRLSR
jgi:Protein of unknown function (DUF2905)